MRITLAGICVATLMIFMADAALAQENSGSAGKSLHLPKGESVGFEWSVTDGGGSEWDINQYGAVNSGSNYTYSNGMRLQCNNAEFYSNSGSGWASKDGNEIEIEGQQRNTALRMWRRIKVYKDEPLARWIDILENTTSQEMTVNVRLMTSHNYQIGQTATSSGKEAFQKGDWAMAVSLNRGNNSPAVLHVFCDPKSKLRPTVQNRSNTTMVNYSIKIPAKSTVALCHFESQSNSLDDLRKAMTGFKHSKYLKDIPPAARKYILNIVAISGLDGVELDRNENSDSVILLSGDPIYGDVLNKSFSVKTCVGKLEVPADKLVGMAAAPGSDGQMRMLLSDGQIISGKIDQPKLTVKPSTGAEQEIPFADVVQWSYKISGGKPEETTFEGPYIKLRTGDYLAFDPKSVEFTFKTQHGTIPLDPKAMFMIKMDNPGNSLHRAIFLNESQLGGILEPAIVKPTLRLGPATEIARDMICAIQFANEEEPGAGLTSVSLANGDVLYGDIADDKLQFRDRYAKTADAISPRSIRGITFKPNELGRAEITDWKGTILKGFFEQPEISFAISPGPTLKINTDQILGIVRQQVLPPEELLKSIDDLVAKLGAESFQDREAAATELKKMPPAIADILRKHPGNKDPEVKNRIKDIVDAMGGEKKEAPKPAEDGE